jgi:hypothetical protein
MKVLVACEESQRVCIAFRERGHEAYSCDLLECSGGHPEWHIHGDVLPVIRGGCFRTMNGEEHSVEKWDMIIAHPPCTYLTVSGCRWNGEQYYKGQYNIFGDLEKSRLDKRDKAIAFFMEFANAPCERVAIENPVGVMSTFWRKPDCIYNPYDFEGETEQKKTCLWLKGLPPLRPTQQLPVEKRTQNIFNAIFNGKQLAWNDKETAKFRSRTPVGVAKAMSEQWG